MKIIFFLITLFSLAFLFSSCEKEEPLEPTPKDNVEDTTVVTPPVVDPNNPADTNIFVLYIAWNLQTTPPAPVIPTLNIDGVQLTYLSTIVSPDPRFQYEWTFELPIAGGPAANGLTCSADDWIDVKVGIDNTDFYLTHIKVGQTTQPDYNIVLDKIPMTSYPIPIVINYITKFYCK